MSRCSNSRLSLCKEDCYLPSKKIHFVGKEEADGWRLVQCGAYVKQLSGDLPWLLLLDSYSVLWTALCLYELRVCLSFALNRIHSLRLGRAGAFIAACRKLCETLATVIC